MANYTTVEDVINTVSAVILEPYNSGEYPGPSLGIISMNDLLLIFADVLEDFVNRSGLSWSIFSQQINFNTPTYQIPENMNEVKVCFVGGQYIDKADLFSLDDWVYNWQGQMGTPEYWYLDGLPPKTLGVALNPNYTGAGYKIPVGPVPTPLGISGLFNGATTGQFTGTLTVTGTSGAWVSGNNFDPNWRNYSPMPSMTINGVAYPLTFANLTTVDFAIAPGNGTYTWIVNIGQDGNLTMVGTEGLSSITYTLDMLVPVLPDSFASIYIAYGILARIFSMDGESKDLQRSYYCAARYNEGINLAAAVSGQMLAG